MSGQMSEWLKMNKYYRIRGIECVHSASDQLILWLARQYNKAKSTCHTDSSPPPPPLLHPLMPSDSSFPTHNTQSSSASLNLKTDFNWPHRHNKMLTRKRIVKRRNEKMEMTVLLIFAIEHTMDCIAIVKSHDKSEGYRVKVHIYRISTRKHLKQNGMKWKKDEKEKRECVKDRGREWKPLDILHVKHLNFHRLLACSSPRIFRRFTCVCGEVIHMLLLYSISNVICVSHTLFRFFLFRAFCSSSVFAVVDPL